MAKRKSRIDIFSELTSPEGIFDYNKCSDLLGDNYDDFIKFCDQIRLIPEEITSMKMYTVEPENTDIKKAIFKLELSTGESMQFES